MAEDKQEVEESPVVEEHVDEYEDTLHILEDALSDMRGTEETNVRADEETTTKSPTYKEAEAEQQKSISAEDGGPEASTEEVSTSKGSETPADLSEEDADVYGNLKPKAQERFEHWINHAKELEATNQELSGSKELQDYILNSTTNPDQLNWSLNVFNNLNSGNYNKAVNALQALDKFADNIGEKLGVNRSDNEASSFSDHEDLSNAVENLEMSEEWANKLASQRSTDSAQNQAQANFNQMSQDHTQHQENYDTAANTAYQAITQWENQIQESDADYGLKKDAMIEVGKRLSQTQFPPQDWLPLLQNEYNVLSEGMRIASQQNGNASKSSRPLAPGRNSGGVGSATTLDTAEVTPEFLQAHLDAMHK
tara:strand:+ start:35 stop:1135 length:1101 start_codon:yes stop_codon:yes gene_type:complete